ELERATCDCIDIGSVDDGDEPARAKRSIPKAVKRHVLHRDGYKCRVPGCRVTENIDCHHIVYFMHGGEAVPMNLIALCEGHHLAVHAGSLVIAGDAVKTTFTWSKQSKWKIETRVVECTAALRSRGVDKQQIKAVVAATRAHVGNQDLTTRQWMEIALTKCVPTSS
ncbi:MAG TPA: HNH endonuclease signature motif containing protein, partial [Kofleriaceae bacterium]|nr:HNH endonuclease signature motif containing protein [Kofleriaceae bacterium]